MVGARGGNVGVCGDGARVVGGDAVAGVVLEEGGEERVVDVGPEGGRRCFCRLGFVVGVAGVRTGFVVGCWCVMGVGRGGAVAGQIGFLDNDIGEFGHAVDGTVGDVGRATVISRGWEAKILDHRRRTAVQAATSGKGEVAHRGVGGAARVLGGRGGRPMDLVGCFGTRAAV